MSFEVHTGTKKIFANKIEEPVVGYLTGAYKDSVPNKFGNHNLLLTFKSKEGAEEFEIVTVGTLNYLAKNLMIHAGVEAAPANLKKETIEKDVALLGKLIRLSPDGSYINKAKKEIKKFKIEVDKTKTLDTLASGEIPF